MSWKFDAGMAECTGAKYQVWATYDAASSDFTIGELGDFGKRFVEASVRNYVAENSDTLMNCSEFPRAVCVGFTFGATVADTGVEKRGRIGFVLSFDFEEGFVLVFDAEAKTE